MRKHLRPAWIYDQAGTGIPNIAPEAMQIVDQFRLTLVRRSSPPDHMIVSQTMKTSNS